MAKNNRLMSFEFPGPFGAVCTDFVERKRLEGYVYNSNASKLREFCRFTEHMEIPQNTLPESVVTKWLERRPNEADTNRRLRYVILRGFAGYIQKKGWDAYVPDKLDVNHVSKTFVPYIFTHDEIRRFFKAADLMEDRSNATLRSRKIMPVLFRLLYCCGLRVTEATGLYGCDVDFEQRLLTIRESKLNKTRYVPMSCEIANVCAEYDKTRYKSGTETDYFFAAPDGDEYTRSAVYYAFRALLRDAGIPYGGKGKGPRVHDFRHTFCVHCLQKWVTQGVDLSNALARLSTYLGHKDFSGTELYLRMTAEVYPEMSAKMEEDYGHLIPQEDLS